MTIDEKINELRKLTNNFLFIEYYSHEECEMYKILNEYTKYNEEKLVLCRVSEGIENALDLAIEHIGNAKKEFNNVRKCFSGR